MIERTETPEDEANNALEEPKSVRTSTIAESEYWTAELGQAVEIIPRGWAHSPQDYALYIEGTFVVAYKHMHEIEEYLEKYFVLQPREETT